jgi:glycosyltransferase involved in cell wall biosynthesis
MNKLSVIIPCYFNEDTIYSTFNTIHNTIRRWDNAIDVEFIFIDDGSKDNTYNELLKIHEAFPAITKIIKLVSNVGSYNALYAGLEYAEGDCNVVISADLQDPPDLIADMYRYWTQGFKLVIANRLDRREKIIQKWIASLFHFLMQKFAIKNAPSGGFDFVLFDKSIKEKIFELQERNSNIFYMMVWMGYDYVNIPYVRQERKEGKSKWTMGKKIKLFVDSFVSFSFIPIRLISAIGIILGLGALCYGLFIIIARSFGYIVVEGWSALMVVLLFVSSFQMIALGILGEYLWRVLDNSRKRPLYMIDKVHPAKK